VLRTVWSSEFGVRSLGFGVVTLYHTFHKITLLIFFELGFTGFKDGEDLYSPDSPIIVIH